MASRDGRLIDERTHDLADLRLRDLLCDALLQLHRFSVAGLFDLCRNLIEHFCSFGSLLLRVREYPEPLESGAFNEVEQVLKFFVSLAWKPDDESGPDIYPLNSSSNVRYEVFNVLAAGFPLHQLEHARVDVLQRNVDVSSHLLALIDATDEFFAPVSRMGVKQADPKVALDIIELAQK